MQPAIFKGRWKQSIPQPAEGRDRRRNLPRWNQVIPQVASIQRAEAVPRSHLTGAIESYDPPLGIEDYHQQTDRIQHRRNEILLDRQLRLGPSL